ncbi:TPA: hypothetical protein JBB06_11645 [Legionella pneumophila subsp. pneumophila]|uniref:hypothetical protein n=1 Tax=Legionella pneumophila TaxID=446 RepID=UPI00031825AD|nr:hypothetical protein [Legionella pneumophila]AOW53349.1 hypothetical protein BE841_13225 [Legionella pneumophila subsp. pneumophila]AOW55754.1 hypothetical protein BE842_10410 [Legionella pneumophila subsp. pneumophila]AOW58683.1 hypothetical protein BE843_10675 [Legionella pneumophila subsp. pneumophila]AOW61130.1 hypothetical protein BE844_08090 [Legionella pneumophila subsp. pneumophila]AOW64147.1 hypothetical protein BE845_08800 [Legionella pneumophila subsp. pneumophila]
MHVLDPLTLEEIQESCDILKREKELSDSYRFAWVMTYEPPQQEVLHSSDTDFDRCAFLSVFNKKMKRVIFINAGDLPASRCG